MLFIYSWERKQCDNRKVKEKKLKWRETQFMLLAVPSGSVFCLEKATTVARLSFRNHGAGCDFTCEGDLECPEGGRGQYTHRRQ